MQVQINIGNETYIMEMVKAAQVMSLLGDAVKVDYRYVGRNYDKKRWIKQSGPAVVIQTTDAPFVTKEQFDAEDAAARAAEETTEVQD
jgi:hypothetical protein